MKISCTQENLEQALAITSRVSTKHANLPILNNILIKASEGGIQFISTNLEIAVSCLARGRVDQPGEYTVPSKLFYDFVNLLPNERVDIDLHDDALAVSCGNAKTSLKGIPSTDFPLIPSIESGQVFNVSVSDFQQSIARVIFAAATNESRPELSGISLVFNHQQEGEGSLVIAATDSYRLGEVVTKLSSGPREEMRVIVPQRSLGEVLRIISVFKDTADAPATLTIQVSDSQVVFTYGTATLISRMIEGVYPDYRQIIPSQTKTQIMIEKKGLVNALKAASLFARSGLFDVYLKVDPTTGSVAFSGSDSSRGKNEVTVDAAILGDANAITLNYRFVIDGVNALDTDLVRIELIDAMNPCIILPGTDDIDRSYRYVVMPIRQ